MVTQKVLDPGNAEKNKPARKKKEEEENHTDMYICSSRRRNKANIEKVRELR